MFVFWSLVGCVRCGRALRDEGDRMLRLEFVRRMTAQRKAGGWVELVCHDHAVMPVDRANERRASAPNEREDGSDRRRRQEDQSEIKLGASLHFNAGLQVPHFH